jgi:hypothetical protein
MVTLPVQVLKTVGLQPVPSCTPTVADIRALAKSNLRALNAQAFLTSCLSDLNSCLTARSLGALELKFSASKRSISADLSRLPRRQAKALVNRCEGLAALSPSNSTSHIAQQLAPQGPTTFRCRIGAGDRHQYDGGGARGEGIPDVAQEPWRGRPHCQHRLDGRASRRHRFRRLHREQICGGGDFRSIGGGA